MADHLPLTGLKADLHRYLQQGRDSLVRTLDGLGDYDIRRPLTPSGTNLLGLVKHLAGVELGYLGESVGVRVVAETAQHAGHAEILRESLDGRGGRDHDSMGDAAWWERYVADIQRAADPFR